MAQTFNLENSMQQSVDFSTVEPGDVFVSGSNVCVKLNNNNPNYVVIDTGAIGKLDDTDQVLLPDSVLVKLE